MFYRQFDQAFSGAHFHGFNRKTSQMKLMMSGFKNSRTGLNERAYLRVQSAMARVSMK